MERSVLNPASSPPNLAKVPCCAVKVNGGFAEVMVGQGFGRFCFGLCANTPIKTHVQCVKPLRCPSARNADESKGRSHTIQQGSR